MDSYIRAGKEPRRRKNSKGSNVENEGKNPGTWGREGRGGDRGRGEGGDRGRGEGDDRGKGRREEVMTGKEGKEWTTNGRGR